MSAASISDVFTSPARETQRLVPASPGVLPMSATMSPATLGDYELHREIGRGGMGIVYEATQISLRRSVAIKTLPFAAVLDQQQIARFRNEAQAAASLHHPHIVPVYAVGCERGVHYYSMQLIQGDTLEQTLSTLQANEAAKQRGKKLSELRRVEARQAAAELTEELHLGEPGEASPQAARSFAGEATSRAVKDHGSTVQSVRDRHSIRSVVRLFVDVAEALDYAHEQGVIHRDIKPSNLLIDGSGKIWVADFGLARCRGIGNLTTEGSALGTARYMSPEQIAGRSQAVDHRTDVYSLGITLYEMLTLQPAFSAPCREQLMRAVEFQQPTPPRQLNPKLDTDLETIILKSISKNKDERYATAGDMADDLRRYLDGLPTHARRPGKVDLALRWAVRHRQMVLLSLFLLAMTLVGLTVAIAMITQQRRNAVQQNKLAHVHLNSAFNFIDRFNGMAVEQLQELPGGDKLLRDILLESQQYATKFLNFAEGDSSFTVETAKIHFLLGSIETKLGHPKIAEKNYQQAINQFADLRRSHPNDIKIAVEHAICLHCLATLRKRHGRYQDAMQLYENATELQQRVLAMPGDPRPMLALWSATQTNFAKLQYECGDVDVAIDRMTTTESKLVQLIRDDPQNANLRLPLLECRNTLAGLTSDAKPALAEELFRKNIAALDAFPQSTPATPNWSISGANETAGLFASLSPDCRRGVAQNNLAHLLAKTRNYTEAVELTTSAIEAFEHVLSTNPDDRVVQQQLAVAQNNRGQILFSRSDDGDIDEAEAAFEQAQQSLRVLISVDSDPQCLSSLAGVLHNLGYVKQQRGQLELAVKDLTTAIEMQSLAVRKAPMNAIFRKYLQLHSELLDQLLHKINPPANSSKRARQVTTRKVGLHVYS